MGLHVLIVEDEPIVAMLLEDYLEELGYSVVGPVCTVHAAIDLIERAAIDVAILDVNINGDRSDSIAETLDGRAIPYIFATGYGLSGVRDADRQVVLQKPYRLEQLSAALAERLAR